MRAVRVRLARSRARRTRRNKERLSQESYDDLESWMQLQLRKIKRRVTGSPNKQ